MAVIDILQHYDAKKKAAHAAKTVKHGVCSRFQELFECSVQIILTLTDELQDKRAACGERQSSVCPSTGRSGDLHGEPRAVLQEVLRFHHHYPVIASRSDRGGAQRHMGKGGRVGSRAGEEKWRREKPSRGWINKVLWWLCISLPHPLSSSLPVCFSLFQWGATLCS